jgi:hypothetical protein
MVNPAVIHSERVQQVIAPFLPRRTGIRRSACKQSFDDVHLLILRLISICGIKYILFPREKQVGFSDDNAAAKS